MNKINGKIVLVDDEIHEKELLEMALHEKDWDVTIDYYKSAEEAIQHLKAYKKEEIFLIISDLEMSGMSGLDFKKAIDVDKELCNKAIPFIFASTIASQEQVSEAYNYRIQGYFKKPLDLKEQAEMLDIIIRYWVTCRHPNKNEAEFLLAEDRKI
jgi:DNA-binding NtrC family response regulator